MKSAPEFQGTDRYQVLRSLGSGTFGSVYEAFDRVRGIRVALKVPHESHALALLLFKQEFRALAEVSHPNLVTLFELVGEGDRWFFTMERLEGVDCQSYLRPDQARPYGSALPSSLYLPSHPSSDELATPGYPPGPPAPPRPQPSAPPDVEQVRRIFRQITEGLLALHRAGLVHRDLKPSNVLVTPEGRVAILDFGLALDLENATEMGETGKGVGTPAYCAPEQVEGRPASAAGDWYSMGIMLYQALVGQLPFTGTPLDMVRAKRNLDALPPSLLVPGLPGDLESLCLDLLVRDPGQRPVGEEILARLTREPPPESLSPQTVPLGRVHEIRILLEALRTFRTGQPVLACVHGASGMGKSMLLRHFLKLARRKEPRLVLFRARCDPEESLPYKAVDGLVDDLSQYLRRLAPADQAALLPDWTPALARLFPVLNQVPAVAQWPVTAPEGQDPMAFRRGAFLALRELLARVARRQPLVLVVEDLQWADGDSAPLLMELLRAPAPPFLLVIAHDQGERDGLPILRDLNQPGLAAECRQVDVALAPLGEEQAVRAARAMLRVSGPDVEVRALWAARLSEGHPFFLAELVHALRLAPTLSLDRPKGMKAFLLHRLESLDGSSRGIVELLCIAGHPLPWRTLMKAYGAGPEAEALLPALRNGHHLKVRASAHGERVVEAYHEGIRRLVQETLPPDRVVEGHQRLAEALEALVPPPHPQLASHYAAAGLSDRASAHALEAAWQARENLAFHQEARFLDLALSHLPATHPDLPALAVRRAEALAWAGRSCDAARAFLRACPLHSGPEVLSQKRRAAEEFFRCGHMEEAVRTLTEVLASVQEPYPHSLSAAILRHLWSRGRLALRGLRPSPPPTAPVPDVVLNRIDILWAAAMGLGPVDVLRTLDFQARHLRLALDRGEPFRLIRGLAHEAVYRALLGNRSLTVTRRILETARALGTGSQDPEIQGRLGLAEGIAALLQGRWLAGARLLDEAELLLREKGVGLSYERFTAQYQALVAWSVVGELGLVAKRYQPLTMEAMERGDLLALCNFRSTMGYQVFLARNDPDGTAHMLDTTEAEWGAGNFHTISYHLLISRVNLFLYLGRATEARATMEAAWSRLRWTGFLRPQVFRITARELLARTLLARAALTRPGSLERRRLLLRVRWMASKLRREHTGYGEALALKLLAGCDRLSRDRTDAAAHLQQAQEAFRTCDMRLHAEVCSHILAQWIEDDTLHASSEAWIRSQGIQAPEAWCRMHLPV